jgi:hypothetical protein
MMHSRIAYPDDKETKTRRGSAVTSGIKSRSDATAA